MPQCVYLCIVSYTNIVANWYTSTVIEIATEIDSWISTNIQFTDMEEFATSMYGTAPPALYQKNGDTANVMDLELKSSLY